VSRTKEALYRENGEAEFDEAGSPQKGGSETERSNDTPDAAVTQMSDHRVADRD
jgi:hypothetical protein